MWKIFLIMVVLHVGNEPFYQEIEKASIEDCTANVTELMNSVVDDGKTTYAAGCKVVPVGTPT